MFPHPCLLLMCCSSAIFDGMEVSLFTERRIYRLDVECMVEDKISLYLKAVTWIAETQVIAYRYWLVHYVALYYVGEVFLRSLKSMTFVNIYI